MIPGNIATRPRKALLLQILTTIKLLPYEKNDQFFPEKSLILVLNTPSAQGDKFI